MEFLTQEPPTGNNTGGTLSAAISELIFFAAKEDGGNWLLNGTKKHSLIFADLNLTIQFLRKYLM